MANKNFKQYAVAGNNITLTYDDLQDTVTFASQSDVTSVNGQDGAVVLVKSDVGLGNVDNTSDVNKPISTATQSALDTKASTTALTAHTSDLNNPHAVTKAQVGLSNVDNTADLDKPISTAVQTALNAKQDSIGYTPANAARTLTINGTTYDLSANRSWSVGDLVSTGSYSNPSWLTALAWGKITGTPTTLSGYGITDGVSTGSTYANPSWLTSLAWGKITSTPTTLAGYGITDGVSTSGSYSNPSWITDLAFSKITGYSVPTLAQVTTAGATTTNFITVGGLTANGSVTASGAIARGSYLNQTLVASANNDVLVGLDINPTFTTGAFTGIASYGLRIAGTVIPNVNNTHNLGAPSLRYQYIYSSNTIFTQGIRGVALNFGDELGNSFARFMQTTGNFLLQNGGTFTDAGFRLDVNGTARIQNQLTTTGTITAASAIARGVYFNQTLTAAANNDVLVGLDIAPTFTTGAFTGVQQIGLRVNTSVQAPIFYSSANLRLSSGSSTQPINFYLALTSQEVARFFGTTGNLLLQNGGTFTDAGFRLDVNGTARIQNQLTTTGTITAASAIARGVYFNQTLTAAANNDVLVGLDINSTFNAGTFTGVLSYGLRILSRNSGSLALGSANNAGSILFARGSDGTYQGSIGYTTATGSDFAIVSKGGGSSVGIDLNAGRIAQFVANGLILQNGGTFTDAGYRLDVVGADARFNGVVVGLGAGSVSTNTVVGNGALTANTTGNNNLAVGYQALSTSTVGIGNTAIGYQSLKANNANYNTAVGFWSLLSNSASTGLVAVGFAALKNTTAGNNTAMGYEAGLANTSGTGLTAIGYQALTASTGNDNTAVGYQAGVTVSTGTQNSLFGYQSGQYTTSGTFNSAIGYRSDFGNTGSSNSALGAGISAPNLNSCVLLGRGATATASNQFVVGSASYPAGTISAVVGPVINEYWTVLINGQVKKIALIA